jgi:hypothetical protein
MLLPAATDVNPFQEYTYADGEAVAGTELGRNFGEGHLADERLIAAVQEQSQFDEGAVLLAVEDYEALLEKIEVLADLAAAKHDIMTGQVHTDEEVRGKLPNPSQSRPG